MSRNLKDYTFEWDLKKDAINKKKHGISFSTAQYVFADEGHIEWYDSKHNDDEDRYKALGKVGKVILVVFTERGENTRIISARLATKAEREKYEYANRYK